MHFHRPPPSTSLSPFPDDALVLALALAGIFSSVLLLMLDAANSLSPFVLKKLTIFGYFAFIFFGCFFHFSHLKPAFVFVLSVWTPLLSYCIAVFLLCGFCYAIICMSMPTITQNSGRTYLHIFEIIHSSLFKLNLEM